MREVTSLVKDKEYYIYWQEDAEAAEKARKESYAIEAYFYKHPELDFRNSKEYQNLVSRYEEYVWGNKTLEEFLHNDFLTVTFSGDNMMNKNN